MRMPKLLQHLSLVALASLIAACCSFAQQQTPAAGSSYHRVELGLQFPSGQPIGSITWLDFDSKGNAYVFRRCAACGQHPKAGDPPSNIWKFDKTGKFLGEWGEGALAKEGHSIRIDRFGFIWLTDIGAHQVKKYSPEGTLLLTLGKYGVPGDGPDTFNMPTDTVVTENGDLFVTDGYGNQRVVKFDKNGKFIKTWGTKGTDPGQFRLPHSIIQDKRGRLIVGDRCGLSATGCKGARIEIFDTDGKFLEQWPTLDGYELSAPDTLYYIAKTDTLYVGLPGKIMIADARTGKVRDYVDSTGGGSHGLAVDAAGDVYGAGIDRGALTRYSRNSAQ
jgi:DNA-binding beta-propeller fold protein YncE